MTQQVYKRTVYVWAIPHVVTVYQKSKTVWAAVGDYMGERIEVEGSSANVTAKWVEAGQQKNDFDTIEALTKQADALVAKLGPEYSKMVEGLEQVDLTSSEGKEFMSILSGLDKLCTK